ncbi:MAG: nucleotidyltransferase family protein [Chloroflexota bacterium]
MIQKRITAVILAAGQAKRMGKAKQLLPWDETTVLGQTIDHLKQSNCTDILVVTGARAADVQKIAEQAVVPTVFNPEFATGEMLSSLQTAVYSLIPAPDAVLVALADQPMIEPQVYNAIMAPFELGQADLVAPYFNNQRGNPVLIGQHYFDELLALPRGDAPRTLLKRHSDQIYKVHLETDTILQDLDRPEDYERWQPKLT